MERPVRSKHRRKSDALVHYIILGSFAGGFFVGVVFAALVVAA